MALNKERPPIGPAVLLFVITSFYFSGLSSSHYPNDTVSERFAALSTAPNYTNCKYTAELSIDYAKRRFVKINSALSEKQVKKIIEPLSLYRLATKRRSYEIVLTTGQKKKHEHSN